MRKKFLLLCAASVILTTLPAWPAKETPSVSVANAAAPASSFPAADTALPAQLIAPSIALSAPIVGVGVNAKGEMDVPSGATHNVGWYMNGTIPGEPGSAVLDAHVFAAFSKLHSLKAGDDIYVLTDRNTKLHFKVTATQTYALADVPLQALFKGSGGRQLNLITCAGAYIPSQGTYDHRLIVYTEFVSG